MRVIYEKCEVIVAVVKEFPHPRIMVILLVYKVLRRDKPNPEYPERYPASETVHREMIMQLLSIHDH